MENEKKSINTNETSLEQRDYSKEYGYLDQLKGNLDFDFYENPVLSESNFYSSIARYIDTIQKESGNREIKIQDFINSITNFSGSNSEKMLYIDKFLCEKKLKWSKEKDREFDVELLESIITNIEKHYKRGEKKIGAIVGVQPSMIPERYFGRFTKSGLEAKVMNKNRENFIKSMRHGMKKAEELKKKL